MRICTIGLIAILVISTSCKPASKEAVTSDAQQKGTDVKLTSLAFKEATANKNVQLIDIRRPEEFAAGHIKDAKNIDFYSEDFEKLMIQELDLGQPVYLYCRSGGRSGKAATKLSALGYKIYDLKGGILDWKSQNFELISN